MKVTIEMDGGEAYKALEQGRLLPLLALNKKEPAPKIEPAEKEPAPKKAEKKSAPKKETAEKEITKVDVREVLAEKSKEGKKAECKALLQEFGANRLPEVDPKDYPALFEKAREL